MLRRSIAILSLIFATSLAPQAGARGSATTAVPAANAAGVLAVFGANGHEPATHPDQGRAWIKNNQQIQHREGRVQVTLAYGDVEGPRAEHRLFLNANPFTLPNGIYTFVILRDGTTSFGHPLDSWEVGTRHAHLAQGRPVVGSGELKKTANEIRLNLLSGTFMLPMIQQHKVPNAAFLRGRILRWFDEVLRAKYHAPSTFRVTFATGRGTYGNEVIFDAVLKPPTEAALTKMCSYHGFRGNNAQLCAGGSHGSGSAKKAAKKSTKKGKR